MSPIEGLTIIHVLLAVLGTLLFLTALGLLIHSAVKKNTYPMTLVSCFVVGAVLIAFPVTKKLEFNSNLEDLAKLTDRLKKNPGSSKAKKDLEEKVDQVEKSPSLSPDTMQKLDSGKFLLRSTRFTVSPHP